MAAVSFSKGIAASLAMGWRHARYPFLMSYSLPFGVTLTSTYQVMYWMGLGALGTSPQEARGYNAIGGLLAVVKCRAQGYTPHPVLGEGRRGIQGSPE